MLDLNNFGFWGFCHKLRNEVPALQNMNSEVMKITFRDDQGDWVDTNEKTFSKLLGAAVYDFGPNPRISVKVFEGSPFVGNKSSTITHDQPASARKGLDFNKAYLSPIQLDIKMKKEEYTNQKFEFEELSVKVRSLQEQYSVNVAEDKSFPLCGNCHLRVSKSHTKRNCKSPQCDDVRICGNLSSHENAKLELKELVSARDKAEGLMKKLKAELDTKQKMEETVNQSFESKVKPYLINTNPDKYTFDRFKERSRLILADTAILRKHYKGVSPMNLQEESRKWPDIIKLYEERNIPKPRANPVRQMLEQNSVYGVKFPQFSNTSTQGFYPYQYVVGFPPPPFQSLAPAAAGCPAVTASSSSSGSAPTTMTSCIPALPNYSQSLASPLPRPLLPLEPNLDDEAEDTDRDPWIDI